MHFLVFSTEVSSSGSKSSFRPSQPIYTGRSFSSGNSGNPGRKVLTSLNDDGSWQASARLATATQSGGNAHSRYKIRRDGSLSLTLQSPRPHIVTGGNFYTNPYRNHRQVSIGSNDAIKVDHHISGSVGKEEARQYHIPRPPPPPPELRSFSVVISDVDVTGNYNNIHTKHSGKDDAFSKAGVASYHVKSNTIQRMNASWKLKSGQGTPSSSELLDFLSYFANNGDSRATSGSDLSQTVAHPSSQMNTPPPRQILNHHHEEMNGRVIDTTVNKEPFLTWSETSRNIPLSSSTQLIDTNPRPATFGDAALQSVTSIYNANASSSSPETLNQTTFTPSDIKMGGNDDGAEVVIHDMLSTMAKLNENGEEKEESEKEPGTTEMASSMVSIAEPELSANQRKTSARVAPEEEVLRNEGTRRSTEDDAGNNEPSFGTQSPPPTTTELEQASTERENSENRQQQQQVQVDVDVGMTESLLNKEEKEGDVFVESDSAKSLVRYNNATHNNSETATRSFEEDPSIISDSVTHASAAIVTEEQKMKKKRSAKSAFFHSSTVSTNNDDDENNNETSTSATSFLESTDNNVNSRMKITDPQQTAADLKKLMSLILRADGTRNGDDDGTGTGKDRKSGTQVVNIVITPDQDSSSTSSSNYASPQLKTNRQKIFFLKTPQVKQMLDVALNDPAVSSAAHKIAAALEADPFPNPIQTNMENPFDHIPSHLFHSVGSTTVGYDDDSASLNRINQGIAGNDNAPSVPDGFPITSPDYLGLHHPNLQFHQALHQMIVNGTVPTSINATAKTNIINIFVINFKENNRDGNNGEVAVASSVPQQQHQQQSQSPLLNLSPFRISIKPTPKPSKVPLPIDFKLFEALASSPRPTVTDPSYLYSFNNKMGLAASATTAEDDEKEDGGGVGGLTSEKFYNHDENFDMDQPDLPNAEKINIFDLIPGDIGTATAVHYAPSVSTSHEALTIPIYGNNGGNNGRNNASASSTGITTNNHSNFGVMPPTAPPSDYFLDFLPDRSREPPVNGKPYGNHPTHNNNDQTRDDILSLLTSGKFEPMLNHSSQSQTPLLAPAVQHDDVVIPPSLAHIQWIFKNQPPPKPVVSSETIFKRKGQEESAIDDDMNISTSDSIMEPEETSNSPLSYYHGGSTQDLVDFLLRLQNVSKPSTSHINNFLENGVNGHVGSHNSTQKRNITTPVKSNEIVYTTKKPFWKFGTKIPVGSLTSGTDEVMNNRLRRLVTALGYSALPTIAAGAAATWPYWVPLVAGRKRRSALFSKRRASRIHQRGKARQVLATTPVDPELTKEARMEEGPDQKWVKVVVITTAKPFTSTSTEETTNFHYTQAPLSISPLSNNTSSSSADYVLRKKQSHPHTQHHQLDVPLLKNFLKNVLYNELNLSTKAYPSPPKSGVIVSTPDKLRYPHLPPAPLLHHRTNVTNSQKIFTSNSNKGQHSIFSVNQNVGEHDKLLTSPSFSHHPILTTTPLSIAASDKKVMSVSTFSTPAPASVYIHNRGDGTSSVTTQLPVSVSLAQWHNNNGRPWGVPLVTGTSPLPDITTSGSSTTTLINTLHNEYQQNIGFLDDKSTIPALDKRHPNRDYFTNHYHQINNRRTKLKLANSIKESERSYTSAALFPLWFPILFNTHSQLSSKLKHAISGKSGKRFSTSSSLAF